MGTARFEQFLISYLCEIPLHCQPLACESNQWIEVNPYLFIYVGMGHVTTVPNPYKFLVSSH